jgi:hypothetical protein
MHRRSTLAPLLHTWLLLPPSLLLNAAPADDESAHQDADRLTAEARLKAEAELKALLDKADQLIADATHARQEADRACQALASSSDSHAPPPLTDGTLVVDDAAHVHAAIAALHTQAVAVLNIKALIPIVLDNLSMNYNQWKTLFLNTLSKYKLLDHMLTDPTPEVSADAHWRSMDYTVHSWLHDTMTPDLIEVASTGPRTACLIYLGLEDQFVSNKETHALILNTKFHTFVQGELSISDYCCRLNGMADALGDLGEVILDRTLVLVVLHGLNGLFSHMSSLLKRQ